ncbi:medium-chain acyl-CoA ligase ACSF2, mitochondrial-like [Lutzomyia longipalpis]|uniref:medium-chain acyl-CoA ligase ACSF2, mitochondrial-like n=1 Tax=Lutzomyia longipalpis TaxID=7200 RepID=UPI0024836F33|nr:medium-chain acyl-CoA ligase ACSF2, mitochondrial-like [Lutzomyia longipalpis]
MNKECSLSYFHEIGKRPLTYSTIGQELSRYAVKYADQEAYVSLEENKRLTYKQLKCEADRLAAGLQNLGLKKGDRLGLWAPNSIAWPLTMFAAARLGLILVPINPTYEASEIEYCLKKVGIKAIVVSEYYGSRLYYNTLLEIIPELNFCNPANLHCKHFPLLTSIIIDSEKNYKGTLTLKYVMNIATYSQVNQIEKQQEDISPESGCNLQLTSGTTGYPKAALLTHFAFVNNGIITSKRLEMSCKTRICLQVSFFHAFGCICASMACLIRGATIVIPSSVYNPLKNILAINDERCSMIYGTPKMHMDLMTQQRKLQLKLTADVAVTGGAPNSPQLLKEITSELGLKKVINLYGMSESTANSFTTLPGDTDEQMYETVGHVMDHVEVKVIDRKGQIVPLGTPGELCVRGFCTMRGYWNDEEKTQETLSQDGWLRTGDQFVLLPNGYGKIIGRIKEIIIRDSTNIYPKEIEDFLVTCPQIAESYVIGVPDDLWGEEICAFVRLRSGCEYFTVENIRDYCRDKISAFKIPRYVEIVEDFNKTLSGKVQKTDLKQMFSEKWNKIILGVL